MFALTVAGDAGVAWRTRSNGIGLDVWIERLSSRRFPNVALDFLIKSRTVTSEWRCFHFWRGACLI